MDNNLPDEKFALDGSDFIEEEFTLEDILREFGSASYTQPPEPVLPGMAAPKEEAPAQAEEPDEHPEPPEAPAEEAPEVPAEEPPEMPTAEEVLPEPDKRTKRKMKRRERKRKRKQAAEEPPVQEDVVEEPPIEEAPVEEPPVQETPAEEPPIEDEPNEELPIEEEPIEEPPIEEEPDEEPLIEEEPDEESPIEEEPDEELPMEDEPIEEPLIEEAPDEEAPVALDADEASGEEAPAQDEAETESYTIFLRDTSPVAQTPPSPPPEKSRSIDELVQAAAKKEKSLERRFYLCLVAGSVGLLLSLYHELGLRWISGLENVAAISIATLLLMLCAAGASYDLLAAGLRQLRSLRFDCEALATVLLAAGIGEAVTAIAAGVLPYCALVSLELLCALWALRRQNQTVQTAAYVMSHSSMGSGVMRKEDAWDGKAAAASGAADWNRFAAMLDSDSAQATAMRVYAPLALLASILLALIGAIWGKVSFLRLWTALLLAALPLSSTLSYILPYALLTERLSRKRAVLCGWYGAKVLCRCEAVFLRDTELFPEGSIRLTGIKTFDAYESPQVMRYAGSILRAAQCEGIARLLAGGEFLPKASNVHCFDEDGYSAEIGKDTVLLGTLGFMKAMGVHLERGTKVRQALYLSINGELAGLIALRHDATPEVRRALQALSRGDAPIPVLTGGDLLVSAALLRAKFRLPLEQLVCPPLRERMRCAELSAAPADLQGAVAAEPGLSVMRALCMGARALVTAVHTCIVLSILAGIIGMSVIFLLSLSGSLEVVSCLKLLEYLLVWAAAALISALSVFKA